MLPDTFHTARLKLRPIVPEDAGPIFDGYAQDTTVTRFVIWRPHRSRSDTEAYIAQCIATPRMSLEPMSSPTGPTVTCAVLLPYASPHHTVLIAVTLWREPGGAGAS
jgi:RimJ/RimL family protein N-acetyltransferase